MNELYELINYPTDSNVIDFETMKESLIKMKRDAILKNHKLKIWQGQGKDKRWKTHLPPNNKILSKSTKEDLEKAIINYYLSLEDNSNLTLKTFYPEWFQYKELHTPSSNYMNRIHNDWTKYYLNNPIIDIPLKKLTHLKLDEWAHAIIKENNLTKKQYYNLQIIMKQSLEYAYERNLIVSNPFKNVKVSGKMFRSTPKKPSETQVFLIDEQPLIIKEAYDDFTKTGNTACLAIPFLFETGLRVGELIALKQSDIIGDELYIQRTKVKVKQRNEDFTWNKATFENVDTAKTTASIRKVPLTPTAIELINKIKQSNNDNGFIDNNFLFVDEDGQISARAVSCRIEKYCKHLNIEQKSAHKIRKTFISTLIDDTDININYIREIVGHTDERTTYGNYCYNRRSEKQTKELFIKALNGTKCNQRIS